MTKKKCTCKNLTEKTTDISYRKNNIMFHIRLNIQKRKLMTGRYLMKRSKLLLPIIVAISLISLIIPPSHAKQGTGILYVYWDPDYDPASLVWQFEQHHYDVYRTAEVYIQIAGITEFAPGVDILIKICWSDHVKTYTRTVKTLGSGDGINQIGVGDELNPIMWKVGDFDDGFYWIPVCETMTVHYKSATGTGPDYLTIYDVDGKMRVAHIHAVPENPLGTLGTISALFLGLGIFLLRKGKILNFKVF